MKKLLIIGASILQLPAIKRAKELGYYTAVLDYNPNAVGIEYADEYFNASTIDIDAVVEVAKSFCPDGIMTLATDMPMRSIAKAASELGLPGIDMETAIKATDKGEMIKAFAECGVAHPWYFIVKDECELEAIADKLTYPCIVKPTDNAGSRGVKLIGSASELAASYEYAVASSRSGAVIFEEYMQGSEVSVEIIVKGGVVHVLAVTDKITTGAPHFVEMGHTQPSSLPADKVEEIKDLACRAVKAVGIKDGPAHVEIMLTEGGAKMVELGARMGGDCITTHLVPLSTGVDMIEATIRIACGEEADVDIRHSRGAAIRYIKAKSGVIKEIVGVDKAGAIPGVCEISFTKGVGDTVGKIGSSTDRVGFVIASGSDRESAVSVCEAALEKINVITE